MHHLIFFKSQIDSEFVTIFLLLCIFFYLIQILFCVNQNENQSVIDFITSLGEKICYILILKKRSEELISIFYTLESFIHVCFRNIIILMRHFIYPSKKHLTFIFIRQLVYGIVVNLTKFFVSSFWSSNINLLPEIIFKN